MVVRIATPQHVNQRTASKLASIWHLRIESVSNGDRHACAGAVRDSNGNGGGTNKAASAVVNIGDVAAAGEA